MAARQARGTRLPAGRTPRSVPWLVSQLRSDFYLGRLSPGDRLPSVRELARRLGISPTTVLNLYKQLEDEGFVEGRPRSGTFLRRLGPEPERRPRDAWLFDLLSRTARKLQLTGVGPDEFARLVLRYTGVTPRADFTFGFLSHRESFAMLGPSIRHGLRFDPPIVLLASDPRQQSEVRARLAADRSIRCLLTTYLYADFASDLALEFGRAMIVVRLAEATARVLDPPDAGVRAIVTRDDDCADAFRRLLAAVHEPAAADRFRVAHAGDAAAMTAIGLDATEIYASPLCLRDCVGLLGPRVRALPSAVSAQTIDDILFQYVFGPTDDPAPRNSPAA